MSHVVADQIDYNRPNSALTALVNQIAGNDSNASWEALHKQADLIKEELDEIYEAIKNRDLTQLRDGIADVLVTTYGLGHRANVPVDDDYRAVTRSNITKFDTNEEDAKRTQEKYANMGIQTTIVSDAVLLSHALSPEGNAYNADYATFHVVKSACDQVVNNKNYPEGKFLKSIHYEEPVFTELPDSHLRSWKQIYEDGIARAIEPFGPNNCLQSVRLSFSPSTIGDVRVIYHPMRVGAEKASSCLKYNLQLLKEEYTLSEEMTLVREIASAFYRKAEYTPHLPFLIFIDSVEIVLPQGRIYWTSKWRNPSNIMDGLMWDKAVLEGEPT